MSTCPPEHVMITSEQWKVRDGVLCARKPIGCRFVPQRNIEPRVYNLRISHEYLWSSCTKSNNARRDNNIVIETIRECVCVCVTGLEESGGIHLFYIYLHVTDFRHPLVLHVGARNVKVIATGATGSRVIGRVCQRLRKKMKKKKKSCTTFCCMPIRPEITSLHEYTRGECMGEQEEEVGGWGGGARSSGHQSNAREGPSTGAKQISSRAVSFEKQYQFRLAIHGGRVHVDNTSIKRINARALEYVLCVRVLRQRTYQSNIHRS